MLATAALFKEKFCKTGNTECTRYIVYKTLGKIEVPSDLFPNQLERANTIIQAV
jgi:hypothetical protein